MMLTRFVNHICGEISIQTHFLISMCANISETGFSCIQTVSSTGDLENVSRNLDSLARCMGCWHTGMSHSIQEDLGVLGYLSFQDDRGGQEDLWNLWTLVGPFWILLVDLGGQVALEPLETQYPFRLSLLANRVPPGDPACPACPGSLVAPQVLVPPWLLRCPGDLEALVGRAGSDWSGNHLESDSAFD